MNKIRTFSDTEKKIISKILSTLEEEQNTEILKYIEKRKNAIEDLSKSISKYPPIIDSGNELTNLYENTENKIIDMINSNRDDVQFKIPTKAVLGKTFLIAKINFFYLLYYFSLDIYSLAEVSDDLKSNINLNMFILLVEEVFIEIIMDKGISSLVKTQAVKKLFEIWEYRFNESIESLVPFLISLWEARKTFEPAYGTLMGTAEFFQLTAGVDDNVMDFLDNYDFEENEEYSVQEFLFGLSYEDLSSLRKKMIEKDINVVNKNQIKELLNKKKLHTGSDKEDPRSFYSFFIERKNNASSRAQFNMEGPSKTLEEHIICYLIEKDL